MLQIPLVSTARGFFLHLFQYGYADLDQVAANSSYDQFQPKVLLTYGKYHFQQLQFVHRAKLTREDTM
jgi:hypothetical protein